MKIKVCGITQLTQLQQLQNMDVDYAGLIFYKGSKRFAEPGLGSSLAQMRDVNIKKIGVFVNEEMEKIEQTINDYGLSAVQLHGDETDEFCMDLMDKVEVIKVFRIGDGADVEALIEPFQNACHYFLFDTDTASFGGSGKQFNWDMLQRVKIDKPFFLSGGIGPDDVAKVKGFHHPNLYALDINSRFETEPGIKDLDRTATFIKALKHE
jgi:phosphoribosylanthranilate isomerase